MYKEVSPILYNWATPKEMFAKVHPLSMIWVKQRHFKYIISRQKSMGLKSAYALCMDDVQINNDHL